MTNVFTYGCTIMCLMFLENFLTTTLKKCKKNIWVKIKPNKVQLEKKRIYGWAISATNGWPTYYKIVYICIFFFIFTYDCCRQIFSKP